jgi:hypothetical protein
VARGRSWGLALTGGRCPDSVPAGRDPDAARRVAVRTEARGAGPGGSESGEGVERRARARVGQPEKKTGWPGPDEQ